MPIPGFQVFLLPTLRAMSPAGALTLAQIRERVGKEMALSEEDLAERLPSGKQLRFHNRINWASIYLTEAGLVRWVRRGIYELTPRGAELLTTSPTSLGVEDLVRYPEFKAWLEREPKETADQGGKASTGAVPSPQPSVEATPEERIETAYASMRGHVESRVIERIMGSSPRFFEELVVELLVKMGYGGSLSDAGRALGRSGDGGVDGIIKEDRLGLDAVYIQAKRWDPSRTVGRPEIQAFAGSLEGERARKGVFITTARFTREAEEYIKRIEKRIVLIDGRVLAALMFDHDVGVRTRETYELKEIDDDRFTEE